MARTTKKNTCPHMEACPKTPRCPYESVCSQERPLQKIDFIAIVMFSLSVIIALRYTGDISAWSMAIMFDMVPYIREAYDMKARSKIKYIMIAVSIIIIFTCVLGFMGMIKIMEANGIYYLQLRETMSDNGLRIPVLAIISLKVIYYILYVISQNIQKTSRFRLEKKVDTQSSSTDA